ncbi:MAG: hypothetical protein ACYTFW_01065 [Planctomycetota bacterium]|jgi:hypothetical protein
MRLLHSDDNQIIAVTDNGLKLTVTDICVQVERKKETGGIKRNVVDWGDLTLMSDTLFQIFHPHLKELQHYRDLLTLIPNSNEWFNLDT